MSDPNERDSKLVQYMNEAYGKERELESALQAHIEMTTKAPYKKRLKQHLSETKKHAKALERRIKKLGGGGHAVQTIVAKATAAAKGPVHALRGSGEQEKMLKNAKTEYFNEHEEIATYLAIETFATKVGDKETAQLARGIRREEERMAKYLEGQIKALSGAVASDEIPASQRRSSRAPARRAKAGGSKAKAAPKKAKAGKAAKRSSGKTAKRASTKAKATKTAKRTSAKAKTGATKAKTATRAKAKTAKRSKAKSARRSKAGK
jgi:ferritin-like metal-binding protein YciE